MIRHTLVVEGMPFLRYENNISEAICVQLVTVTVSTAVLPEGRNDQIMTSAVSFSIKCLD